MENAMTKSPHFKQVMPIANERFSRSPALSRLKELALLTKRYDLFETEPGQIEVLDYRDYLDRLLQFPELRPGTDDLLESHLDEFLGQLSSGPTLDTRDMLVLAGLMLKVKMLAPDTENRPYDAYDGAYDSACVLRGTLRQVEYFLLSALDHRVQ
jgi:hypothetical protein